MVQELWKIKVPATNFVDYLQNKLGSHKLKDILSMCNFTYLSDRLRGGSFSNIQLFYVDPVFHMLLLLHIKQDSV